MPAVEYKGYRILPAPYLNNNSSYQTAGTIEKDTPDGVKRHEFVRADTYDSRDDAVAFTISKAKQVIDQLGDRMFNNLTAPAGSGDSAMARMIGVILLSLMLAACSQVRSFDQDGAYFSSLFSAQGRNVQGFDEEPSRQKLKRSRVRRRRRMMTSSPSRARLAPESPPRSSPRKATRPLPCETWRRKPSMPSRRIWCSQQRRCRTVDVEQALK